MAATLHDHRDIARRIEAVQLQLDDPTQFPILETQQICEELSGRIFEEQDTLRWESTCYELIDIFLKLNEVFRAIHKKYCETLKAYHDSEEERARETEKNARETARLSKTIKTLQDSMTQLNATHSKLEADHEKLVVGGVAFMAEASILKNAMQGVADPGARSLYRISELEKAIDGQRHSDVLKSEGERNKAETQLKQLKLKIGWEDRHSRDLKALKGLRLAPAHPEADNNTDLPKLKEFIKNCGLKQHFKDISLDLITMVEKLN